MASKTHSRWVSALVLAVLVSGTIASGKTKLIQSWADPAAAGYKFTKFVAVAVIDHPDLRSAAEAAMVRNIKRVEAVPSGKVLQEADRRDVESAKKRLREQGFDGAVVMRLIPVGDKVQYVAPDFPTLYTGYWSYYNWAMPLTVAPGRVKYDRIAQVETLFYSLKDDKLLWSGVSETSNPDNPGDLIDQIAKVIAKELRKNRIIK